MIVLSDSHSNIARSRQEEAEIRLLGAIANTESKLGGLAKEAAMKPLIKMDESTTRAMQWLESNVKGPLLTICRAILERDSQALESVCTEYFAGDYAKSEALSLDCNRQLAALQLGDALRTGYAHSRASNRNRSGLVLICDARRTILYVMKDFDKNIVVITGQVRQEQELAVHTIETIKHELVESIEARLSMC